jgi:hypothetical protein
MGYIVGRNGSFEKRSYNNNKVCMTSYEVFNWVRGEVITEIWIDDDGTIYECDTDRFIASTGCRNPDFEDIHEALEDAGYRYFELH